MKEIVIGTILICLLHSILIVEQDLGINIILFTMPLLFFIVFLMKKNGVIKNKYGLLFIIPIVILSLTYFIYDNTFKYLNGIAIPVLYLLMYIFTIKPVNTITDTLVELLNILIKPINNIGKFTKEICKHIPKSKNTKKISKENMRLIKSLLIVIPVVIVVLMLLSSADSIFGSLFNLNIQMPNLDEAFERIIRFIFLFFILGSTIYYITKEYLKDKRVKGKDKEHDSYTINLLLIVLNIIYVVFDIIQINSLMLHRVASGFNYADYARTGFFQLMFITFINITIILISKKCKEETKTKIMSIIMVFLTYIIIASSFYRMFLYEQAYGYTILRLGVYTILITEAILLIPTIVYIINKKTNILNYYMIISIMVYTFINCFSVDRIIAENNIKRYDRSGEIDVYYLENKNYDNIEQLRELYKKIEYEPEIKQEEKDSLRIYIGKMDKRNEQSLFGYNLSKEKAKQKRD